MTLRRIAAIGCTGLLFAFATLCIQIHQLNGGTRGPNPSTLYWIIGPDSERLERFAREAIEQGLRTLNDTSLPSGQRLGEYQAQVRQSEQLLTRALLAYLANARAIALLAAVRWELDPPLSPESRSRQMGLIGLASAIAPDVPGVQMQLGELLMKMSLREDALRLMATVIALDPGMSAGVVGKLRDHSYGAQEILGGLPTAPEVLVALRVPFIEDGKEHEYLGALEEYSRTKQGTLPREVLNAYGSVCRGSAQPNRLHEFLTSLNHCNDSRDETVRWYLLARASLALQRPDRAIKESQTAFALSGNTPSLIEGVGG